MKNFTTNKLFGLLFFGFILLLSYDSKACHAIVPVDFQITQVAGGIEVDASSHQNTCGCDNIYWLDIEVRCLGEAFDGGPFNPGFYGPLFDYPYFQSDQMNKDGCILTPYPTTFIPYTDMCPGITYQIRVRENHNGDASNWTTALQFTVPGTIDPLDVVINAPTTTICEGDCVTLTTDIVGGCDFAANYSWNTGQTTDAITVCPTVTTTYTVDVTEDCSGESDNASVTITVLPTAVAGTATINDTEICLGQTTDLTLTGSDGTIQWQTAPATGGPWSNIGGATTTNLNTGAIPVGDHCYRAEVTGCGGSVFSNTVCVTVHPIPVVTVDDAVICAGETTTLTANVDITGGTYLWNTGQTTQSITVSPGATTTYDVTYTLNGCPATDDATVTVNPQPTTLGLTDQTICAGASATLTANPDVTGGTYNWSPTGETTQSINVSPAVGTNTYTLDYVVNGCDITETVDVIVNPVPVVTVTDDEICAGETTSLTANVDITGGTFSWTPGGETTQGITVTPGVTTTYEVTYTLNNCPDTDNATVTVNPLPVADFDFTEVCEDLATDFNSTSTVAAPSTIVGYEWDINNNGTIDYTTANPSHSFNSPGTYTVSLTVTTDDGCSDQITQTIDVFPLPQADFSFDAVCLGNTTDFVDLSTVVSGTITDWMWDFDDGSTSNVQNPSHTYTNSGSYNVSLTVTTDNGCDHTITSSVDVLAQPVADFTFANDCYYNAINFTDASSAGIPNFAWDFDDGTTSTDQNPTHTYAQEGTYDVTLIIATNDGCGDTVTQTITAYPQPNADFDTEANCYLESSEFQDQSTVNTALGDAIVGYTWDFGDGTNSTDQNPTHAYGSENSYSVTLEVITNNGCVDSHTETTNVYPLPEVDFTPNEVCQGDYTSFLDNSSVSNVNTTNTIVDWVYDFGDGGSSSDQNPFYTYEGSGVFNATLTVTSNHGCVSTETIPVTVHDRPDVSFVGNNLEGCSPVCFDLNAEATVLGNSTIDDYTWNLSGGISYSGASVSDCFTNFGTFSNYYDVEVVVTTNHGCTNSHSELDYITVHSYAVAEFNISPNQPTIIYSEVDFNNTSYNGDSYLWNFEDFGSSSELNPTVDFGDEPGIYNVELIAYTNYGCNDTVNAIIDVKDEIIFHVPNTFTPDGDQFNETFQPVFLSGYDPYDYNLLIFNRWGEVIFESNNADIGWDGTYGARGEGPVKDGTYIWKIEFKETMSDKRHVHTGHVNLLR